MGLLDDIEAQTRRPGGRCAVGRVLNQLDAKDAADLEHAIADEATYTGEAIARALTARGHQLKGANVQYHRNGKCACGDH